MRRTGLLALVTVLCGAAQAADAQGQMNGRLVVSVRDQLGSELPGSVFVHADPVTRAGAAPADVMQHTDDRGQLSINLAPGFVDVCVMASAFEPDCRKVLIQTGQTTERNVALTLDQDVIDRVVAR